MSPPVANEGDTAQVQMAAIRKKVESLCQRLDQEQSQAKKLRELHGQKDKAVKSRLLYYAETKRRQCWRVPTEKREKLRFFVGTLQAF